jgi:hypothetical protein
VPDVDKIFEMLLPAELAHVEAGRPAGFAWSFAKRSGLPISAATIASLNEVYGELRRRLGYTE